MSKSTRDWESEGAVKSRFCCALLAVEMCGAIASAAQITPAAFGPNAAVETFEQVTPGSNVGTAAVYLLPGVSGPYTFASGITMTSPIPNNNAPGNPDGPHVYVVNYATPYNGTWGFGGSAVISAASQLPFGTAFLANDFGGVTFTFPSPVTDVGAYVNAQALVRMQAFDAAGNLLDTQFASGVPIEPKNQWPNNFLGIGGVGGISRVNFYGSDEVLNHLLFQPAVPEPAIATATLLVLAARRRRRPI